MDIFVILRQDHCNPKKSLYNAVILTSFVEVYTTSNTYINHVNKCNTYQTSDNQLAFEDALLQYANKYGTVDSAKIHFQL